LIIKYYNVISGIDSHFRGVDFVKSFMWVMWGGNDSLSCHWDLGSIRRGLDFEWCSLWADQSDWLWDGYQDEREDELEDGHEFDWSAYVVVSGDMGEISFDELIVVASR
jgi:hypothetical protein